jgi:hypothetical protein
MNAKVVIYLLISAFVLSGCTSYREKNKAAWQAHLDENKRVIEESKKMHETFEARQKEREEWDKEFKEYLDQSARVHAEYNTWYDSLSTDKQAFIDHELEEKQIRYNQIYGFNPDGSSRYDSLGIFWTDRFRLLDHYKPIWDNLH